MRGNARDSSLLAPVDVSMPETCQAASCNQSQCGVRCAVDCLQLVQRRVPDIETSAINCFALSKHTSSFLLIRKHFAWLQRLA
eukprot:2418553-Pleurochrysis_carterae.AAC.1